MGGGNSKGDEENKVSDESMQKIFRWLDTDHSGFIEMNELQHWVAKEPKYEESDKEEEAKKLMTEIDKDQDGKISLDEFKTHFGEFSQEAFDKAFQSVSAVEVAKIKEMFKLLDLDADGYVDRSEFKDWITNEVHLNQEDEEKLFKSIDVSGNDKISQEELVKHYCDFTGEQLNRITTSLYERHAARLANIRSQEAKEENDFQAMDEEAALAEEKWEQERLARQPAEPVKAGIQRQTIQKILDEAEEKVGSKWYVISYSWFRLWKEYVGFDAAETPTTDADAQPELRRSLSFTYGQEPGPIDNTDIAGERPGEIKLGTTEHYDWELLPEAAWTQLREWYGGGPVFVRECVESGSSTRVDIWPHIVICVWADSVTGKPNPAQVSRQSVSRSAKLRDLLDASVNKLKASLQVDRDIEARMWLKPHQNEGEGEGGDEQKEDDQEWQLLPDDKLDESLEAFQMLVSGDTVLLEAKNEVKEWPRDQFLGTTSSKDFRDFEIGDEIDAQDPMEKWYQSVVRDVKPEKIFVHYEGWSSKYDEWIPRDSERLAPKGTHTQGKYQSRSSQSAYQWSRGANTEGSPDQRGVVGLRNLGNTCFMNSTLQCMSNTEVLTKYFISDEYKTDLNRDNPLGHMGRVADEYANFLKDVWSNKYTVVAPAKFKHQIGEFAPQFAGYQQQDSSELLSFLLDGLHEDLNRIQKKPYTQDVESKGRDDLIVAREAWETYRLRNDSFIVDYLTGQLKSTIVCPIESCGRVSVKFDPYAFLSVPLPIPTTRTLVVTLVPADGSPSTVYGVTVPKRGTVATVIDELRTLAELKEDSQITIGEVQHHRSKRMLKESNTVGEIRDRDVLYAFETIKAEPTLAAQPDNDNWRTELKVGDICDAKDSEGKWYESDVVEAEESKVKVHFCDWPHKWNEWLERDSPKLQPKNAHAQPTMFTIGCYHMKMVPNTHYHATASPHSKTTRKAFGVPFLVSFQSYTITNAELHELVAQKTRRYTKADQVDEKNGAYDIVVVNSQGTRCGSSVCKERGCDGCAVPKDDKIVEMMQSTNLAIVWHDDAKAYDTEVAEKTLRHESAPAPTDDGEAVGGKNLYDCLKKFTSKETLSKEDMWYCSDCKEHRQATKKFDVWSTPEVLIIHLKRFSFTRVWREKLDMYVDFPLDGLDMSDFLLGPPPDGVDAPIYDCFGVSNHMGGLGGGHYTAYTRNPNGKWYNCDDSHVSEVNASQVKTRAAYLLFYKLRRN